jgi:hypothetical protein
MIQRLAFAVGGIASLLGVVVLLEGYARAYEPNNPAAFMLLAGVLGTGLGYAAVACGLRAVRGSQ